MIAVTYNQSRRFTLDIIPTAQMRDKIGVLKSKMGRVRGMSYKAKEQKQDEFYISGLLAAHRPETPFDCPIVFEMTAYMPIPKSKPDWWKEAARNGVIFPTPKPDLDNILKNIKDCMTKMNYWRDDSLVIEEHAYELYSDHPRWLIKYTPIFQPSNKKEYEEMKASR